MKRNEMLMLGAAAIGVYFLTRKKAATSEALQGAAGSGDIAAALADWLGSFFSGIGGAVNSLTTPTPSMRTYYDERALATVTPTMMNQRWTSTISSAPQSNWLGISSFGVYNPAAIQQTPQLKSVNLGATMTELMSFASSQKPGTAAVATGYSSTGAYPIVAVQPNSGDVLGLYTTAEVYMSGGVPSAYQLPTTNKTATTSSGASQIAKATPTNASITTQKAATPSAPAIVRAPVTVTPTASTLASRLARGLM